jgi:hypothetical protein
MAKDENILNQPVLDDKKELYEQLYAIDDSILKTIETVLHEIKNYDPNLFAIWEKDGLKPKITTYLLHYIIPLGELLKTSNTKNVSKLLAAELLSFFAWRTFDNCVDGHEASKTSHLSSLASCMTLIGFVQENFTNTKVEDIYEHYRVMAEQALQESEQPIALHDIWKRCSVVFYAAESLAKLDKELIEIFKNYINYTGLAHDMADIANDISNKIVSLPVYWLSSGSNTPTINNSTMKKLYCKIQSEVKPIENKFSTEQIEKRFPLMNYLIVQSSFVFHEK